MCCFVPLGFWFALTHSIPQVTRIDGTVDSPPCLKVTHKTFGTQNSNNDMVYCRLSMPVEFYSADKLLEESLKLRSDTKETLSQQQSALFALLAI